jgi:hypothetical protein
MLHKRPILIADSCFHGDNTGSKSRRGRQYRINEIEPASPKLRRHKKDNFHQVLSLLHRLRFRSQRCLIFADVVLL